MSDTLETKLKATIIDLVKAGRKAEDVILLFHWTEALLAQFDVKFTVDFVAKALDGIFQKHSAGRTTHAKKYANFAHGNPWSLGAMVGSLDNTSGAKVISFGLDNSPKGLPVSHADAFLIDKDTGVRKMTLECIGASDLRTGWFALVFFNLVFHVKTDVEVLVMGAGPVAEACIRMLNYGAADKIKGFKVLSKSGTTNHELVERLKAEPTMKIPLEATNDRAAIPLAEYLITATNAGKPVVDVREIGENAAVLSQGIDDLPKTYIERLITRNGQMLGDDLDAMEQRNVDPLALYYSRQKQRLTIEGKRDGAINIGDVFADSGLMRMFRNRVCDVAFFPVGLIAYDIAVNKAAMVALIASIIAAAA
jgi:ornithine cyclodeaminase/alanine dehydrogenase-like protein (mu-crystallin family)